MVGTAQNYVLSADDVGHVLECQIQARDKEGRLNVTTKEPIGRAETVTILNVQVKNRIAENEISMTAQVKGVHSDNLVGMLSFYNGNDKLADEKVVNGCASYTWTGVKKGKYNIRAEYQPDDKVMGSVYKSSHASRYAEVIGVTSSPSVSPKPTVTPKPSIVLSKKSMVLDTVGTKTGKLTVRIVGQEQKATFKSSNSKIVSVDQNGNLTALKAGQVKISAAANGVKAYCDVVVKKASIKLVKTSLVLYIPQTTEYKLIANVSGASSKANFKSNNTSIVKVDAAGRLTVLKEGKTTIKASANGLTATCKVEVKKKSIALNLTTSTIYLKGKNSIQLKPVIAGPSKKVSYKSSNAKVARVNSKGKIVAVGKGTATITVRANDLEKKCKVTVLPAK